MSVLIVLHGFAFSGLITNEHPDILPQWLPTYCFLGRSLASGHIPAWNPYVMGGVPFAADPQSGWGYLPAMLLFSILPCTTAIRWFIVVQPILAGLGVYAFSRSEGLSRASATAGGVALALVMSSSYAAISLPVAGSLAWTALLLAAASRCMHSGGWSGRVGWSIVTALAWGQLATAHLSNGLVMGTAFLAIYLVARGWADLRAGRLRPIHLPLLGGLLLSALPLVNLALLLPRVGYLPRSTLGLGYARLQELAAKLAGQRPVPFGPGVASPGTWPLGLALYFGVLAVILVLGWWWGREHRTVAIAFALAGAVFYVLSLESIAVALGPSLGTSTLGQFYLHEPYRFRYGTLLAIALLVPFGTEAWTKARSPRDRALVLAPGIAAWMVLMTTLDLSGTEVGLIAAGAGLAAAMLLLGVWRPALVVLMPAVIAAELTVGGLMVQADPSRFSGGGPERPGRSQAVPLLAAPTVPAAAYAEPDGIARTIEQEDRGRYATLYFGRSYSSYGYLGYRAPTFWPLLANQRSVLLNLQDVAGYNPTELRRFWTFVRAADPKSIRYNVAFLYRASSLTFDLLQVRWVIGRPDQAPPGAAVARFDVGSARWVLPPGSEGRVPLIPARREGSYELYEVEDAPPRASVVPAWSVVSSPSAALAAVTAQGFDPSRHVVLEGSPSLPSQAGAGEPGGEGTALYRPTGAHSAEVDVTTPEAAVVLVRDSYDEDWHATVDGRSVEIIPGDYVDQAIPVPAGRHTIELTYDDPSIGQGLVGSGVALAALAVLAVVLRRRERMRGA
ncbi:MAG TPA: hypothetical protein VF984_03370 [Actinomycetota bacterium]